jgi:hypothetical protein
LFDAVVADAGIEVVLTGVRMPRMNAIMERGCTPAGENSSTARWSGTSTTFCERCAISRRSTTLTDPTKGIADARPLCPLPPPITDQDQIARLDIRRHQRLGGSSTTIGTPSELHE